MAPHRMGRLISSAGWCKIIAMLMNENGKQAVRRLESLDALRGFDMFLLIDAGLVTVLFLACGASPETMQTLRHAVWEGCNFRDLIAPLFMFMVGASFPLSLAKSRERGLTDRVVFIKALRRLVLLFACGLLESTSRWPKLGGFPIFGTLQLIAMAGFVASCIYLFVKPRWRLAVTGAILLAMTAVHTCVICPCAPVGAAAYSVEGNVIQWLHRVLYLNCTGHDVVRGFACDASGPFCVPNAAALVLMGMFAGEAVFRNGMRASWKKVGTLLLWAAGCGLAGCLAGFVLPSIKSIWTSTFVLITGAFAFLMFALFHAVIDVLGFRKWAFFFRVIGLNSITIYLVWKLVDIRYTYDLTLGHLRPLFPGLWGNAWASLSFIALEWGLLYFLYRKKIFIKIG